MVGHGSKKLYKPEPEHAKYRKKCESCPSQVTVSQDFHVSPDDPLSPAPASLFWQARYRTATAVKNMSAPLAHSRLICDINLYAPSTKQLILMNTKHVMKWNHYFS